jgi:hypothetical protein
MRREVGTWQSLKTMSKWHVKPLKMVNSFLPLAHPT